MPGRVPRRLLLLAAPALLVAACAPDPATIAGDEAPTPTGPATATATGPAPTGPGPTDPAPTDPAPTDPAPTDPGTPGDLPADAAADLTVAWDDGAGSTATWTLSCGPGGPGGDHPDPAAACAALTRAAGALDPVPRDVACTEIYGGPQTATVSGTLDGADVVASLSRSNGCQIDRWESLVPLLPSPVPGA